MEVTEAPPVSTARPKPKRLRYLVAGGLCAAAVVFLLVGGLSRNIVYFRTVSEAVQAHEKSPDDTGRLRDLSGRAESQFVGSNAKEVVEGHDSGN